MDFMESVRHALFEDPLYVYVTLGFVELALAAVWHARRGRWRGAALLVPPVLAAGVFLVERLVVTDREQIHLAMREIASWVEAGDFEKAAPYLDEEFSGPYGPKAAAVRYGSEMIARFKITSLRWLDPALEIRGDRAALRVTSVLEFAGGPLGRGRSVLTWTMQWIKRAEGWRIHRVERPEPGLGLGAGAVNSGAGARRWPRECLFVRRTSGPAG